MLRIRKVLDDTTEANRQAIVEAQSIMRRQFPGMLETDIGKLPDQLRDPVAWLFVTTLLVAENARGKVQGVALLLYFPDINFSYLELVSAAPGGTGRGIGDALYGRVREEAVALGAEALFFECLPDDPALSPNADVRAQNASRLKFYERFGARPLTGTAYETPLSADATDPPYLVADMLGRPGWPSRALVRAVMRAILERKYGEICPPDYITMVVESVVDDPVRMRAFRYVKPRQVNLPARSGGQPLVPVVVNDKHDIHHVHDRGYVEAPARVRAIMKELEASGLVLRVPVKNFPERHITEVHDAKLVSFIRKTCQLAGPKNSIYPYVFPVRNATRPPKEQTVLAGYYCIDTFTPLNENAWLAARRAVDCTLTAAERVLQGAPAAYALVRPPGHHAESKVFGGFCYFCNSAIAAHYLSRFGKVAILDIDYHHGNGQQDIFYRRSDVLTVSIHGDPSFAYPYFTGFRDEKGLDQGGGFNINIPLPETITPEEYRAALSQALQAIRRFEPAFLVVSAGFDTAKGDPTGTWSNLARDFIQIGRMIGQEGYPTLIVQEGGYKVRTLGTNVRSFFAGLVEAQGKARMRPVPPVPELPAKISADMLEWRDAVNSGDVEPIRALVAATGFFSPEEIGIAAELAETRLSKGTDSGYEFILAERQGHLLGYACFGKVDGTQSSFDLYWIAVEPNTRGSGLGKLILDRAEAAMRQLGATSVYADTSSSERYRPTRAFYESNGYYEQALLADFYAPGDGKVIYEKTLT